MDLFAIHSVLDTTLVSDASMADITRQLELMNQHIEALTTALESRSFWNSQLFAAIIGASAGIIAWFLGVVWVWHEKRREIAQTAYRLIIKNLEDIEPRNLLASVVGSRLYDNSVGKTMVIVLRRKVKHWLIPGFRLKRLFKEYEDTIRNFDTCNRRRNPEQFENLMRKAEGILERIETLAFKKTGETRHTV